MFEARQKPGWGMQFETNVVLAAALMIGAFIIDWPRALAGLALGAVCRFLPYGTIVVPLGVIIIAAVGDFAYPLIGRTAEPTFGSFVLGLFSVAGTASTLYITLRNLKDRL
jgi:hypothetical protein